MKEQVEIITRFISPSMTAGEYIKFSKNFLLHMRSFHPIFSKINSWGSQPNSWTEIDENFSNFENVVFEHIYDPEINYNNTDHQSGFTLNSISFIGFSNSYSNTKKIKNEKYSISIGAGDEDGNGIINLKLPWTETEEFYQTNTIKLLVLHILKLIPLTSAYVITDELFDEVVDFNKSFDVQIGWLNFFKNKIVLDNIPADVPHESSSHGCFFWLKNTIEKPDKELISTAIGIRDILGDLSYLD